MCKAKRSFRKKGNMLSGVIGRHQIRDDRRYIPRRKTHMTEFVEEDFYTYRIKNHATKKTTFAEAICETSKEELRRMVLTKMQAEQQETYSAYEKRTQATYIQVEEDVVDTKPKKKKNKRVWLVGLGICLILVGGIVYGSKNK